MGNILKSYCILLFSINCFSQVPETKFNVSHGIEIKKMDSLELKKVKSFEFQNCRIVAFPETYSKKIYSMEGWAYFLPDSLTVDYINKNIAIQYCYAVNKFMDRHYNNLIKENDGSDLRKVNREYRKFKKNSPKNCLKHQERINFFDKQLIGYINAEGEKIIIIEMIDFKEDPYNLKELFGKSWISGWHGWFETNMRSLSFHLKDNRFTINEDL